MKNKQKVANSKGGGTAPAMPLISLHGGHSSDFCLHAMDPLILIVHAYDNLGYKMVGITEHMPPPYNRFRYPDEVAEGLEAEDMRDRFNRYFETARRLAQEYAPDMKIFVGFETEWYSDALPAIRNLISIHKPDYLVGSVHHIGDIPFDYSEEQYALATEFAGGLNELYQVYFDQQFALINTLEPAVVGHFDLIRLYDPDYRERMQTPSIKKLLNRNLELIKEKNLILDLNTRAYTKGASEPYPCRQIIEAAREMDIDMVPSDDSHGVCSAGYKIEQAIHLLENYGFDTDWEWIENRLTTHSLRV